ncbi:MAG TPA: hypothetical protein VF141_13475 [Chryseolinea sp.]
MTDDELVNDFVSRIAKEEITFDKIRPTLVELGLDEVRIKKIVLRVDDEIQKSLLAKGTTSSPDRVILTGAVLLVVGVGLTVGSLAGLFSSGNYFFTMIAYSSLIAALVLIVVGLRRKKKKNFTQDSEVLDRRFRLRNKGSNEQ